MVVYLKNNLGYQENITHKKWEICAYLFDDIYSNMNHMISAAIELGLLNPETDAWLEHVSVMNTSFRGQGIATREIREFETYCKQRSVDRKRIICFVETDDQARQVDWENHLKEDLGYSIQHTQVGTFAYKDL